ncbi:oxidoreductase domain protein [Neokomagataea thailandica NBRC 106555]|uniref:Gfo/Idh/MocA family oxidoreductase n=2 Tax=Neokomagataea TaxID=1223423 RepID=A0A4Y6V8C2_9PROT|nr:MULTISPECIES: Gfo/Idh/MocA family oxidoreductase [Neokomagataea]QDH24930.1 gfo/Idh/MocA family oxidoreductase [Neokomagataea tanensis]GBR51714.1 oxidoreductase domain protein [Neokomagataea thailandica NBRC 106555]
MSSNEQSNSSGSQTRRNILKVAGTAGLAFGGRLAAQDIPPNHLAPRPAPQSIRPLPEGRRTFGYAIIGLGKYAVNQIIPAFAECKHARLAGLVSGDRQKAERIAAAYDVPTKNIYSYDNFDDIKNNPDIDAVYIILPNSLHADIAERAFKAGKHVMCEKPMATSVEDAQRMVDASRRANKQLMIGYRCHFDPITQRTIELIRAGHIGKPRVITTENTDALSVEDPSGQWRVRRALSGGGSLMDLGIYGVNASRYLLNEDPIEVTAVIAPSSNPIFSEVEDIISWTFRYKSGALAHGNSSFSTAATSRFGIQGEKLTAVMDPATGYYNNTFKASGGDEVHVLQDPMFQIPALNQFSAQLDHLPEILASGAPSKATGLEGLQDVKLIQAIYRAAALRRPVSTDWGDWRKI